jgi:hypothetical protein
MRNALLAWGLPLAVAGALFAAAPATTHATPDPCRGQRCEDPPPAATPELDSIVLFGAGGLVLAGVAWRRRKAN